MALATQDDVEARLGRDLTESEGVQVEAALDDASAAVVGYCRQDFEPEPYPTAVVGVVAKMVARGFARGSVAAGFTQGQTVGPFAVQYGAGTATGDVWLTAADKLALRPYRRGGGMSSVQLVGDRYAITESSSSSSSSSSS